MKKIFPLNEPAKAPARVVEGVKHEVRKYVRREHHKELPEGFDLWSFACRVGPEADAAADCALGDINAKIDAVAAGGSPAVYVEIIATPVRHPPGSETPVGRAE